MSTSLEEFVVKFRRDELTVAATEHWTWSVRPGPATLGAGVISLNRFETQFGRITPDEAKDLQGVVAIAETRTREVFQPEKFNYLMLMMVDVLVHFHVVPRYAGTRAFASLEWDDPAWPKPPAHDAHADRATDGVLFAVRDALRR